MVIPFKLCLIRAGDAHAPEYPATGWMRIHLNACLPSSREHFLKYFIYFIFRGEGRKKERETNINVWLPLVCLLGTWPATQARALTGNQTRDPVVHRPVLSPVSHTSQGGNVFLWQNSWFSCSSTLQQLPWMRPIPIMCLLHSQCQHPVLMITLVSFRWQNFFCIATQASTQDWSLPSTVTISRPFILIFIPAALFQVNQSRLPLLT